MPTFDPSTATYVWVGGFDPAFFDYIRLAVYSVVVVGAVSVFTIALGASLLAFRR